MPKANAWMVWNADGFLLGGILIMYELHNLLHYILLFFYSFWIPQIVASVVRDARKPLHPHYIVGVTLTRLAIPLYTFGCPKTFMGVETNLEWCIGLTTFLALQAAILLLQHYLGARCFIPHQVNTYIPLQSCERNYLKYQKSTQCPHRGSWCLSYEVTSVLWSVLHTVQEEKEFFLKSWLTVRK